MKIQMVKLMSADGMIERVVVEDLGDVLAVCRRQEYEMARLEKREPVVVGFRRSMVVELQADDPESSTRGRSD